MALLTGLGLVALLTISGRGGANDPQETAGAESMSEDVRRMHERLTTLSEGDHALSGLRIEVMEGSMTSHRSYHLEAGKLVSKEWASPGQRMIRREGPVSDSRVSDLLRQLIAKRYWTFEGTRFVPDAPLFLFRFHYRDLDYVDFRCDADELEKSPARMEIRNLFLTLVDETEMREAPAK